MKLAIKRLRQNDVMWQPYIPWMFQKKCSPEAVIANIESFIGHVFNQPNRICAFNTYQFSDYSKYAVEVFDEESKRKYRDDMFPVELESAFSLGMKMAKNIG